MNRESITIKCRKAIIFFNIILLMGVSNLLMASPSVHYQFDDPVNPPWVTGGGAQTNHIYIKSPTLIMDQLEDAIQGLCTNDIRKLENSASTQFAWFCTLDNTNPDLAGLSKARALFHVSAEPDCDADGAHAIVDSAKGLPAERDYLDVSTQGTCEETNVGWTNCSGTIPIISDIGFSAGDIQLESCGRKLSPADLSLLSVYINPTDPNLSCGSLFYAKTHSFTGDEQSIVDALRGQYFDPALCTSSYSANKSATYLAGSKDNFSLPTEPAAPSTHMMTGLPLGSFVDFDHSSRDTQRGHTFYGLENVGTASLEVAYKTNGGGSSNDVILLEFWDENGRDAVRWGRPFGSLPTGVSTSTPKTLTLNLADLTDSSGNKINLIPKIREKGFLDVRVGDDTNVDYFELSVIDSNSSPLGQVAPLGNANISISGDQILVNNLSDSGEDGFHILTDGSNSGFGFDFDATSATVGSNPEIIQTYTSKKADGSYVKQSFKMQINNNTITHTPDFSQTTASSYKVQLISKGVVTNTIETTGGVVVIPRPGRPIKTWWPLRWIFGCEEIGKQDPRKMFGRYNQWPKPVSFIGADNGNQELEVTINSQTYPADGYGFLIEGSEEIVSLENVSIKTKDISSYIASKKYTDWQGGSIAFQTFNISRLFDFEFEPGSNPLTNWGVFDLWRWSAENSSLVTGSNENIVPDSGDGMIRVDRENGVSQVTQFLDVTNSAGLIDTGSVIADFSIRSNVPVQVDFVNGPLWSLNLRSGISQNLHGYPAPADANGTTNVKFALDGDPSTWETVSGTHYLPPGTRFLQYQFFTNGGNAPASNGVYFDDAIVSLRTMVDDDNDKLDDIFEQATCMNELDRDSDDDGILDGDEDVNKNGKVDNGETDPCNIDTDGDGIQDGTEIGVVLPIDDPDETGPLTGTDTNVFIPDADPTTKTLPTNEDTDGDGKLDGEEDSNQNGAFDPGETDPNTDGVNPPPSKQVPMLSTLFSVLMLVVFAGVGFSRIYGNRHSNTK